MKIILFCLFINISGFGQEVLLESKSFYHIEKNENGIFTTSVNSTFIDKTEYVLHEKITDKFQSGADGSYGRLEAIAYDFGDELSKKIKWTISDLAHSTEFRDGFYIVSYKGCCDSETTDAYFDTETGRKLFSANSVLKFSFSNGRHFMISFLSISASKDFPPQFRYSTNVKMLITLSSEKEVISRLVIKSSDELGDYDHTPDDIYFHNEENMELIKNERSFENKSSLSKIRFGFDYWGSKIGFLISDGDLSVDDNDNTGNFSFDQLSGFEKDSYLFNENFQNLSYRSPSELRLLRNEIFARNNHPFKNADLRKYFGATSWYIEIPDYEVSLFELRESEKIVLERISGFEQQYKNRAN